MNKFHRGCYVVLTVLLLAVIEETFSSELYFFPSPIPFFMHPYLGLLAVINSNGRVSHNQFMSVAITS